MSRLVVASIVEGYGEVQALPVLLRRLAEVSEGRRSLDTLRPIRVPRSSLLAKEEALRRATELAARKLLARCAPEDQGWILLLLDADEGAACRIGPELLGRAKRARGDQDITCVLAEREFETWIAQGAESLGDVLDATALPPARERAALGKAWVRRSLIRGTYSETVDQPRLAARFDLDRCREHSASFARLCREFRSRLRST